MRFSHYTPFSSDWTIFTVVLVLIVLVIGISEFLRNRLHWSAESTRKLVHILVGIAVSLSPLYFQAKIAPMVLAAVFIILNMIALRQSKFAGMHDTDRHSFGTVFFPLSYLILVYAEWTRPLSLMLGLLMMTFADTAGSIVGQGVKNAKIFRFWKDSKTVEGSVAVFVMAYIVTFIFTNLIAPPTLSSFGLHLLFALMIATVSVIAESISFGGSDNLSVPLIAALTSDLFFTTLAGGHFVQWLLWCLISLVLFGLAVRLHALQWSGAFTAFVIGLIVFGSGGIKWIVPLILFFGLSSILSRIGKRNNHTQKGSERDFMQVFANGGLATGIAIVHLYIPSIEWTFAVYLSAIAAATADTWATEIGYFSRGNPHHILSWKELEKGFSGGVTFLGFFGAILGSGIIALTGWYYDLAWQICLVILVAGFTGNLIDSFLGGSVQSLYRCSVTGDITEKVILNGQPTVLIRGWRWMDNDMVNFINTLCGALITLYIFA